MLIFIFILIISLINIFLAILILRRGEKSPANKYFAASIFFQ